MINYENPSGPSWRSARAGPVNQGISGTEVTFLTLPIPQCANSVLCVDYTEMRKFWGYDCALLVTCVLTRFTRDFLCTKHITGEETIKILLEKWLCVYGAPKEIKSDKDITVRPETGW